MNIMIMMYRHIFYLMLLLTTWSTLTHADQPSDKKEVGACGEIGDCPTIETDCNVTCGCDKTIPTTFNNDTQECVVNMKLLILTLKEKYDTEDYDTSLEDDVATKLRAEADRIFKGIIVAALLFITCASICVLTACMYCCRMNYADYRLKKNIKVLAKKVGAKPQQKKPTVKPTTQPMAESCNVVVEDAGVFCV